MSFLQLWPSALSKRWSLRPAWANLFALADHVEVRLPAFLPKLPATLPGRLAWSVYTLICFVIFLLWTFPTEVILDRLVVSLAHKADVHVDYRHGTLAWPGQVVLGEVVITSPTRLWMATPQLQLSRLAVQPSLLGLFRNRPLPLRLEATGYGGEGWAAIDQTADGSSLEFVLRQLELERLPFPTPDRPVSGRFTVQGSLGSLKGELQDLFTLNGPVSIQITDGVVQESTLQGIRLPALQTLAATLEAELSQGRIVVHTGRLLTDGVEVSVQGSITLRTPLAQSRLDLELRVKKTGTPPPALASLISLLPDSAAAGGRASITGVLGAPQIRSMR